MGKCSLVIWVVLMPALCRAQTVTKEDVREAVVATIEALEMEKRIALARSDTSYTAGRVALADSLFNPANELKMHRVSLRRPLTKTDSLYYYTFIKNPFAQNQMQSPVGYAMDWTWTTVPVVPAKTPLWRHGQGGPDAITSLYHLSTPIFSPDKSQFVIVYKQKIQAGGGGSVLLFSRESGRWKKVKRLRGWINN